MQEQYYKSLIHMDDFLKGEGLEKDSTSLVNRFY